MLKKVFNSANTLANYTYLADGTKLSVEDDAGNGFVYRGSFIYSKTNGEARLERVLFNGGQFYAAQNGDITAFETLYHVTDHLGSVRVVVDSEGVVREQNQYAPYGMRWEIADAPASANPWRFNGKEDQVTGNIGLTDFGARMYDCWNGCWITQDPLAEKYYPWSPYAFCAGNPIRYIDPYGMEIAESSRKEWERNKEAIERDLSRLQTRMDKLVSKGASESRIGSLGERISSINSMLGTMGQLEGSTQVYALAAVGAGELGGLSYNHGAGVITIGYNGTANFVHEVIHGGQFESGDIAFTHSGASIGQDVFDEVAAYRAQHAYNPASVAGLISSSSVNSAADITTSWVQGLVHNGATPYAPGGIANTGIAPIGVNSNREAMIRAYPHLRQTLQSMPTKTILGHLPYVYYKR